MVRDLIKKKLYDDKYRKKHKRRAKEIRQLYSKKYKEKAKENSKKSRLKTKWSLSLEEYEALFKKQKNLCAICKEKEVIKNRRLAVDHCHKNGRVRELLCRRCNMGIGIFQDNQELFKKAINYLKKHES